MLTYFAPSLPFNIIELIRNVYFKYIKIRYLCYSDNARRCRKADLETSRLFYEQFWYVLPIILTKNYAYAIE